MGLARNLRDSVRKLARSTPLDQLQKSGVKNVNVLGVDRIVALIEEAVSRSLRRHLLVSDREKVVSATSKEFLDMLRRNEDLERSREDLERQKGEAEAQTEKLFERIQSLRGDLDRKVESYIQDLDTSGEDAAVRDRLDEFTAALDPQNRDRVKDFVQGLLDHQRKLVALAEAQVREREVERLQRRLDKLSDALERSERAREAAGNLAYVESGISSVYSEVQGLSPSDQNYQRKKELISDIFRANLLLQKGG